MPTATHALWALQTMNQEKQVPDLSHVFFSDLSWWAQVYPPGFDLLPDPWREGIESNINEGLENMQKPYALHKINYFGEI
jgi:hypothetical protein